MARYIHVHVIVSCKGVSELLMIPDFFYMKILNALHTCCISAVCCSVQTPGPVVGPVPVDCSNTALPTTVDWWVGVGSSRVLRRFVATKLSSSESLFPNKSVICQIKHLNQNHDFLLIVIQLLTKFQTNILLTAFYNMVYICTCHTEDICTFNNIYTCIKRNLTLHNEDVSLPLRHPWSVSRPLWFCSEIQMFSLFLVHSKRKKIHQCIWKKRHVT